MTPAKPLNIYTVRIYSPLGTDKVSMLTTSKLGAILSYRKYKEPDDNVRVVSSLPTCNGKPMTELHCLTFGTMFQAVHKGGKANDFDNDEYSVKSPALKKLFYNSINHTYLCLDGEGNKHYIDAYEWVIKLEDNNND